MFTSTVSNIELRQGDIIKGLYFPNMKSEKMRLIGGVLDQETCLDDKLSLSLSPQKRDDGFRWLDAHITVSLGLSIVLSQCCDLEKCKNKSTRAFVVAPLITVPHQIRVNSDDYAALRQNTLTDFISLFFIPAHPPLLQHDYVVDYNMLVSLPVSDYQETLSRKILQMTDEERIKFKCKLMQHFGRPTIEELDAKIYPSS